MNQRFKDTLNAILPETVYEALRVQHNIHKARKKDKQIRIPNLVVCVGQACNFRCKDCGNFAPYSPKEFLRYDVDTIIADLKCILKYAAEVKCIGIQGGEPFVYSDLPKLLTFLGEEKARNGKIDVLSIQSNGSVFPPKEVIALIKKYDISVRLSDYGIFPEKIKKNRQAYDAAGIKYWLYEFASGVGEWYDLGSSALPRTEDKKIVHARFDQCSFRDCLTLEHGELWHCSRAPNSHVIQNFAPRKSDYVKVRDNNGFKKELYEYLLCLNHMEACRYCNGTDPNKMIPAAIQMEPQAAKTKNET